MGSPSQADTVRAPAHQNPSYMLDQHPVRIWRDWHTQLMGRAILRITEQQVRDSVSMSVAMELVERALLRLAAKRAVNHPRRRVAMESRTLLHYMAAGDNDSGLVGIKVYASNPKVGAPNFVVLLFDANTAELLASIDANTLGQIRTGAASGIATRQLSRDDASRLALFGSGFQAETQLEAVSCARELTSVRVYSRNRERRESFASRMSDRLDLDIVPATSPEDAMTGADIVTTVTNSRKPVFPGHLLHPGTHINAAGSNHIMRRELDAQAIEQASLIAVDSLKQARMEAGDLTQAADEGVFRWDQTCELHDVIAGHRPGRESEDQITLFESQGLAIEDIALAEFLYMHFA